MNSSETTPSLASASPTACGPSARNDRARRRSARLASWRAAFALGERMLVSSEPRGSLMSCRPTPTEWPGDPEDSSTHTADNPSGSWKWAVSGGGAGGLGAGGRRQGVLRHLDQCREGLRVGHRELGEHAAVYLDAGCLEALDESVVGHPVRPRRGVDALDPQPPERALAVFAARVGVGHRVEDLLLGLAVQARSLAAIAARPLEDHPALLVGVHSPLHACHRYLSLRRSRLLRQQLLDPADVRGGKRRFVCQAAGSPARLVLEQVVSVRAAAHHLSGGGEPEPLSGPTVGLHLWHRRRLRLLRACGATLSCATGGASVPCT